MHMHVAAFVRRFAPSSLTRAHPHLFRAVFLETLAALRAPCRLHIAMVGPDVPLSLHGACFGPTPFATAHDDGRCGSSSLRVTLHRAPRGYDAAVAAALPAAALVFAPNAGVPAYPSMWRATAAVLARRGAPPLALTDFTREAAHATSALLASCGLAAAVREDEAGGDAGAAGGGVRVNPFRRPMCGGNGASALPAYSNGWLLLLRAAADGDVG
jgi:hypothetical protein